jgi:serine phosphatase RsbU (regulator of sigma subunit)
MPLRLGGFPLGIRAGFQYTEERIQLKSGDVVVLMTDGIIETQDDEGRFYSDSGRLEEILGRFTSGVRRDNQSTKVDVSAEAIVEAIFNDTLSFGRDKTARDDDMTVVVARIE